MCITVCLSCAHVFVCSCACVSKERQKKVKKGRGLVRDFILEICFLLSVDQAAFQTKPNRHVTNTMAAVGEGVFFNVYGFVRIWISSECWGRELNRERGVVWDITWLQYATASPQKVTSSIPTSWAGLPSFFSPFCSLLSCCFPRFFLIILLLYSISSPLLHFVFHISFSCFFGNESIN